MPSSGFTMVSPCASMNASIRAASRVTSVGAMNSPNRAIANFSLWSRMARGRLNTRAPSRSAASSRYVEYTYSMSNGGSLRISTAAKSLSARFSGTPASYQSWSSGLSVSGTTRARVPSAPQNRSDCSSA